MFARAVDRFYGKEVNQYARLKDNVILVNSGEVTERNRRRATFLTEIKLELYDGRMVAAAAEFRPMATFVRRGSGWRLRQVNPAIGRMLTQLQLCDQEKQYTDSCDFR